MDIGEGGQTAFASVTLPLVHVAVVQLFTFQDCPFFLGGYTSLQSSVVDVVSDVTEVEVGKAVVKGVELETVACVVVLNTVVADCAVVVGIGVG